jgi:hypothetical protein
MWVIRFFPLFTMGYTRWAAPRLSVDKRYAGEVTRVEASLRELDNKKMHSQ